MSRERRAVVHHVQDGGKSAVALLSRSARAGLTGLAGREMVRERVATHSCNAATVTQAGGWNGLPASSHLVQAPAPFWRPWTRAWNSEASRGERGGHDRLEPVGGAR